MNKTCILIGEDNLLIESGALLIQKRYLIKAVISSVESIVHWCYKEDIPVFSSMEEYLALDDASVDYLFSIVNGTLLTKNHLNHVKKAAFNYHDSLLPSYAGLNATTWAILNNEKNHGITWHLISSEIDSGDIVYQKEFILADETALSLNLRCFEEAIIGLIQILDDIETNRFRPYPQLSKNRSYFGKGYVLPDLGFINWNNDAQLIERYYRGLSHGHYDNKVGTLKLYLNNSWCVVSGIELGGRDTTALKPGEIIAFSSLGIEVATSSSSIIIKECKLPTGKIITPLECIEIFNLYVGFCFQTLDKALVEHLSPIYSRALNREQFWVEQFKQTTDHNLFSSRAYNPSIENTKLNTISLKACTSLIEQHGLLECFISFVLIYLYRVNDYEPCSCFLIHPWNSSPSTAQLLFGSKWPLISRFKAENTIADVFEMIKGQLQKIINKEPYLNDLFVRHPALEDSHIDSVLSISLRSTTVNTSMNSIIHFELDEETLEINITHKINLDYQEGELKPLLNHLTHHLSKIMHVALTDQQALLNSFELISDDEREKIYSLGRGKTYLLPGVSIYELFKKQALLHPNSIAIYEKEEQVTYAELFKTAERIASYIKSLNIRPQTPIALYMSRSKEMLFAVLGILGAECIYVPLDKKYPKNKIDYIMNSAQINYLFSKEEDIDAIENHYKNSGTIKICLISKILSMSISDMELKNNVKNLVKNDVAYIMFTSGTTGMPKGVVISQENVINYCYWFTQTTLFNEHSIIDFSSSLAFDLSIPCTLAPLICGGALTVCSEEQKINPELYLHYLKNHKITHTELTPGYLELLLHYQDDIRRLSHLRYLLLGADTVHTDEVKQWMNLCPQCEVVNEYGPTETTVSVTSYFVNNKEELNSAVVPIGSPSFNSTAYLFDKYMNLCPIGMRGELCIGGKQVALGYLNNEELTKKKFIPVHFNGKDVLYKTGDLACWLPNNVLQFFGRNDHQVKIHGYRVELPAIEAILMKHKDIAQAVVVIRMHKKNHHFLRAYLVLEEESSISNKEINLFLAQHLPAYMIPKEFCIVNSIPLKENEKINFDLLEVQSNLLLRSEPHEEDHELTSTEKICLSSWQKHFHSNTIQVDDDFFSLGGDSLIALHIISDLKNKIHQDIHLSLLFKYPTIQQLALHLEDENKFGITKNCNEKKSCLIELALGDHQIPLFLVHPVGGTIFWYQQLAQEMKDTLTVYGIEDPCINDKNFSFSCFEEMADYYVDVILDNYQGETIYLGGASFGANLAFEMTNKLIKQGKKIGFLGLFDGWVEYPYQLMQHNTVEQLIKHQPDLLSEDSTHLKNLEDYRRKLLMEYQIASIKSNAYLFKAKELWQAFAECNLYDNGWKRYIDGVVTVYPVPGNHETMFFAPHVKELAELIKKIIIS